MQRETHERQLRIWEEEHLTPFMFPFVASTEPNPGVVKFWEWLVAHGSHLPMCGLEVCCGKGRNAIWLAGKGAEMRGFDFSTTAIEESCRRVERLTANMNVDFQVLDATSQWPYGDKTFDFVVDCFGSSDIESEEGKQNVLNQALRVLKPGGYFCLQIDTPEMGFFAERLKSAPGSERNTLIFPNGKVESVLTQDDITHWTHGLKLVEVETYIETTHEIFGQTAPYKYFWIVAQAPLSD